MDRRVLIPLIIMATVEYEVFTISKTITTAAQQDAWISIIIGAVFGSIFIYILLKLASRFPETSYFHYLKIVWGKYIGFLLSTVYLLFWLAFLSSIFYETILANKMLFLPQTPAILPLIIFALSLIWLVRHGAHTIIRFFYLLLPFLLLPLFLLVVLCLPAIRISNLSPVFANGIIPVLKGSLFFLGSYQGPEVLLFMAPLIMKIRKAAKPALFAYGLTVFFGWANTVAAIGILGVANVTEAVLPGISVVNMLQFPGFPVERFGLLLTLPWLVAIYTTLAIYLYLLCKNSIELFNIRRKEKLTVFILTVIPIVIAYFIPNENWHEQLRLYLMYATVPVIYIIPILTFVLAIVRKKGRRT